MKQFIERYKIVIASGIYAIILVLAQLLSMIYYFINGKLWK